MATTAVDNIAVGNRRPLQNEAHPRLTLRTAIVGVMVIMALLVLVLIVQPGSYNFVRWADNIVSDIAIAVTLPLCFAGRWFVRGGRTGDRDRSGLPAILIGLGMLSFILGDVIWTYLQNVLNRSPFPSAADGFYLAAYPLLLVGILLLPSRPLDSITRMRLTLDGLVIMSALFTFSWYWVLGPTVLQGGESLFAKVVGTGYPISDLVLLYCVLTLWGRATDAAGRRSTILLSLGLIFIVITDMVFAYQGLQNTYKAARILDAGWPLGYALLGLGAYAAQFPRHIDATDQAIGDSPSQSWFAYLPFALTPAVFALDLWAWHQGPTSSVAVGVYFASAALIAFILVRQALALTENNRLLGRLQDAYSAVVRSQAELEQANGALRERERELAEARDRLREENLRMGAELDVSRRLQQMVLPRAEELAQVTAVDVATYMQPAAEVGGDYLDVLPDSDGNIKIGIGDVTGHGLESGAVMLMVQMAVRTLLAAGIIDPAQFLDVLNRAVWGNIQRMETDKNLTLSLLDYRDGHVHITGQHESLILARAGQPVEVIDTLDFGFPIGLVEDISTFLGSADLTLHEDDVLVLYSDGIVEAENADKELYGIERMCAVIDAHRDGPADAIKEAVVADVFAHINGHTIYDDVSIIVLKQLTAPGEAMPAPALEARTA